ncbi:PREDICTED: nuclear receptor subfamily 1 group I member 2-like, partial [Nanorana parkeri]|uniref:nuclear receptor subfamily 1 group I member 2-like n=1 Tax=Nanorana parkeri TaxID=125878 RepID=UPI000854B52E
FHDVVSVFRTLTIDDQIALLKGSSLEICVIRFNTVFNTKLCIWECGKITYNLRDMALAGFRQFFLEPLLRFHSMLKKLNLQMEEYALMQAICLFSSDRPGVTDHETIDRIQEQLALTLMSYIEAEQRSLECRFLFAKIMECLTELRTVNDEHSKQVLQIWDIQPGYTPLLLEVFSKLPE